MAGATVIKTLRVRVVSAGPKTAYGHSRTLRVRVLGTAKK